MKPYQPLWSDGRQVQDGIRECGTRYAAIARVQRLRREGRTNIDVGCMQINHHYHGGEFASLDAMFDPRSNVEYAARFLKALHDRHETWTMAVARYHAGRDNDPAQKQYVCRVISNLVASGYGKWTPAASRFCG